MPQPLSGPGQDLPVPQFLYPSQLYNAPADLNTNRVALNAGDSVVVPAGTWYAQSGLYSVGQISDPISGIWRGFSAFRAPGDYIKSDGFNFRFANLTGCPVAGLVTVGGTGYNQSTATIVSNTGGSTWQAIVGGAITTSSITSIAGVSQAGGVGYGVAPILVIAEPPLQAANSFGGIPATGYATISSQSVSAVSINGNGAGYGATGTIAALLLTNPFDPNIATVTAATCYFNIGYTGQITAAFCTNNGAPASPTLTVSGGSSATVIAVNLQTITAISVTNGGAGFTNLQTELSTVSGRPAATPQFVQPSWDLSGYVPRRASLLINSTSGGVVSLATIIDGGLFAGTPNVILQTSGAPTSAATIGLTLGATQDTIQLQPAP